MQIRIKVIQSDILQVRTDILAVGVLEQKTLSGTVLKLDRKLNGALSGLMKLGDFEGKAKTSVMLYTAGKMNASRVLLIGLGKEEKIDIHTLRQAAMTAATKAIDAKAAKLCVCLHEQARGVKFTDIAQAVTEGLYFGAYRYDEYISQDDKKKKSDALEIAVIDPSAAFISAAKKGIALGSILGQSQCLARTLANRPANALPPQKLAAEARKVARQTGLRCTVFDEKQLAVKKMGGILAVGQGSASKPRLIILDYKPAKASKTAPVIGLVGKAITFDSGGISIKPGEGMQDMKFDKSGGIAVLGAMRAIAQLKPKVRVIGLIPSAENMPSGFAYRPGDIVTTYSGKTVEIQNTDAEGRMILCDAIAYAEELGCRTIVDVATLTGACVVALGQKRAGVMGNDEKLVEQLKEASKKTGERIWHLPCDDEFVEAMKSKVADLKNTGGRWGGACTAAGFLSQFVKRPSGRIWILPVWVSGVPMKRRRRDRLDSAYDC